MKNIKKFDSYITENIFYFIPYADMCLLEIALSKIEVKYNIKKDILKYFNNHGVNKSHVGYFIWFYSRDSLDFRTNGTLWEFDYLLSLDSYYINLYINQHTIRNARTTYMGEIKLEDYEISGCKYNL